MRSFFVKNILFVIAVNILVKPIWVFLIDRNVQNCLPKGDYGTYQALLSLSIIFQTVLDFGITNYNSRTISQNPDKLSTLFPAMLSARFALILIYMFLAFGLGWLIGYRGWELNLLIGVLLIQSLNALVAFIRSNVAALHRFKTDGLLSITDRLLMIIICGFLLLFPATAKNFKIEWFVITQIVCYFISAVVGYVILKRIANVKLHFSIHLPTILKIIKDSFPYALLIFQMSIYNRADAMMIERLCVNGKEQADIWAAAFRLLDVANMFGLMFATILLPMFGRMLSQKQDVQPIVKLGVNMMLPVSIMIAIAGILFSSDIMHLLYKNKGHDCDNVFSFLIASFPSWCLMYIYSTLLTANGNLKVMNVIAFAGVLINLSLNYYLINNFEAVGGAVASLITQTTLAFIFVGMAKKILKLPVNIKWLQAHLGYIVLMLLMYYCINNLGILGNLQWMLKLLIFGIISFGFIFLFRFISIKSVKQLFNKG